MATLALRAYRLEHGAYPPTLAALVPGYLKAVPEDPFALVGPIRYKLLGASYVLYSIGPDGKDDGGKPIFERAEAVPEAPGDIGLRHTVKPDSQGDVVAGVNVQ